nr:iron ABC transporter permease [Marinobacter salinexigens]
MTTSAAFSGAISNPTGYQNPIRKLILGLVLLAMTFCASLAFGQTSVPGDTLFAALFHFDATNTQHLIVTGSRFPRAITATLVGAALAVAGALMQALTRNPLASPAILGVNAGAVFAIVCVSTLLVTSSMTLLLWVGLAGAAAAAVLVYSLGSAGGGGPTPVRLVLAGAAITALFVSFTQALLVTNQEGLDSVLFWLAGSVSGRPLDMVLPTLPLILPALMISVLLGRQINLLMSGDDIAKGLGQNVVRLKALLGLLVVCLAGSAVALAGSVGFVGLIVPHMVRGWFGRDHRWVIPGSALVGAILLLAADTLARFIIMPQEIPVGVMTALIGTPFFIVLCRRGLSRG